MDVKKAIKLLLDEKISLKYLFACLEVERIRGCLSFESQNACSFIGYDYQNQVWIDIKI